MSRDQPKGVNKYTSYQNTGCIKIFRFCRLSNYHKSYVQYATCRDFHFCIWYAKKTADRYYIVKQSLSILIHEGQLHGHEYTAATKHINEGEIITCAQKNHHPELTTGQGTNRHTKSSIFIVHRNRLSRWLAQLAEKGLVPIWNVAHFRKLVSFISLWFIH